MVAAHEGNKEICEVLVKELKADVNAVNTSYYESQTALMKAAFHGNKEICELLIKAGANVNAVDKNGKTALIHAAYRHVGYSGDYKSENYEEFCRLLIKSGADVDAVDNNGKTALMWAAQQASVGVFRVLVEELGADFTLVTNNYLKKCKKDYNSLCQNGGDRNAQKPYNKRHSELLKLFNKWRSNPGAFSSRVNVTKGRTSYFSR